MNILIVKLSAIGDVILSLPLLDALRRTYSGARISWLVEDLAADILRDHPQLDRVIVWRRRLVVNDLKNGRLNRAFKETKRFWREVRSEPFDLVIDTHGLFRSGILTGLSRGRRRLGHDKSEELSYLFLNERLPAYDPDRHALLRYLDVAVYLGAVDDNGVRFTLTPHPQAAAEAHALIDKDTAFSVVINPGAKWPTKLWPMDSWVELCRRLAARPGLRIILTGAPDERSVNKSIARRIDGILDLTGLTSLRVLSEVMRSAAVVVCPDTGPMHLAAAVGTPVVALFGPTAPWRTGPFGPGHTVLRTGIPCSPCFLKKCPHTRCLTDLTPEQVFESVTEKMSDNHHGIGE